MPACRSLEPKRPPYVLNRELRLHHTPPLIFHCTSPCAMQASASSSLTRTSCTSCIHVVQLRLFEQCPDTMPHSPQAATLLPHVRPLPPHEARGRQRTHRKGTYQPAGPIARD